MKIQPNNVKELGLIPTPSSIKKLDLNFPFTKTINIEFDNKDDSLKKIVTYFTNKFSKFGLLRHQEEKNEYLNINIKINNTLAMDKEAYNLDIGQDGIQLNSSDHKGLFYGIQTLLQVLEIHALNNCSTILGLEIKDHPRFKWRGLMLDVGRHMMPIDFIKRCIDIISSHKMNIFHWHLTEDQGWRIPIKKFPKLKSIAAFRKETLIGHYNDKPHKFDGSKYGGFYEVE